MELVMSALIESSSCANDCYCVHAQAATAAGIMEVNQPDQYQDDDDGCIDWSATLHAPLRSSTPVQLGSTDESTPDEVTATWTSMCNSGDDLEVCIYTGVA